MRSQDPGFFFKILRGLFKQKKSENLNFIIDVNTFLLLCESGFTSHLLDLRKIRFF